MSESVKEYRIPLMIGAGALVVALLMWALLVAPQNSKLMPASPQDSVRVPRPDLAPQKS